MQLSPSKFKRKDIKSLILGEQKPETGYKPSLFKKKQMNVAPNRNSAAFDGSSTFMVDDDKNSPHNKSNGRNGTLLLALPVPGGKRKLLVPGRKASYTSVKKSVRGSIGGFEMELQSIYEDPKAEKERSMLKSSAQNKRKHGTTRNSFARQLHSSAQGSKFSEVIDEYMQSQMGS